MTLQDLLNEEQYGKEYCKFQKVKDSIEKNYDKDTDIFHASGRIQEITKGLVMTEDYEKIVDHICNKCELVENRLYNEDKMSPQYKSLQAASILEDCNKIISKADKRGTYETIPSKEQFAKVVSTAKYFVESYLDGSLKAKKSNNAEFNRLIAEEDSNIEQVL